MNRIEGYFQKAEVSEGGTKRMVGVETETLLIDKSTLQPISMEISQMIMRDLTLFGGWKVHEEKDGKIVCVERESSLIFYELGWNNFELVSPAYQIDNSNFMSEHENHLAQLGFTAQKFDAIATEKSWDKSLGNTLMLPDKRDKVWIDLDGEALFGLGHIASIHFSVDLTSIEEGESWIAKINELFAKNSWPPKENFTIWQDYIKNSLARYEYGRYGHAPKDFSEYCKKMSEYKVVMNTNGSGPYRIANPVPFYSTSDVDINLFVRSVWWWTRYRVRGNKLVLEIRDIPRTLGPKTSWELIRDVIGV